MATVTSGRATDFIQFSRTSNATVTDRDGKIKWAGHNLLTNSESFDASAWSKSGLAATPIAANSAVAPNGTTTADKLVENTSNSTHFVRQLVTVASGDTYHISAWVKAAGRNWAALTIAAGPGYYFNLSTGAVGSAVSGTGTVSSPYITDAGSGWWKVGFTIVTGNTTGGVDVYTASADATASYTGDGTSGVLVWGAHLYRSDLGGMVLNPARGDAYYPTTPRNLLGFTEDFSNAAWAKTGSVTSNAELAPNGLQTADLFSGAFQSVIYQNVASSILSTPQTASVYLKRGSVSIVRLTVFKSSGGQNGYVDFDLSSGSAGTPTGNFPPVNPAITSVGNGWYRCSFRTTFDTGTGIGFAIYNQSGVTGDFYLWGAQLSDSASLDAYSPVYGAAVTSAAYYAPRLDFDAVTLAARGLLVEEQRGNAVTHSSDFTQWSQGGSSAVTANVVVAPDGTTTADDIERVAADSDRRLLTVSFTGDGSKALSVFVKYNTSPSFLLRLYDSSAAAERAFIEFTFTAGVPAAGTPSAGSVEAIENVGGGWYRIKIVASGVVAANTNQFMIYPARAGSANGQKTTFWGAQAEVQTATFSTSLIPTNGATATRTADVASVSTQAFPYSASAGSWVAAFSQKAAIVNGRVIGNTNTAASPTPLSVNNSTSVLTWNGANALASSSGPNVTGSVKAGMAYDATGRILVYAGTAATSDAFLVPSDTAFNLGAGQGGGNYLNGWIRQITYIPRRLSNAELQARTV